jgi:hypothetical protein
MPDLSGFPSAEIQYDKDGKLVGTDQAVLALAADPTVTDLVVLAHGWNDDIAAARSRYAALAASLRAVLDAGEVPALNNRRIGIAGLMWPAKQFGSIFLVPGGAPTTDSPVTERDVVEQIDRLRPVFPGRADQKKLDAAAALVPELVEKTEARDAFVDDLRSLVSRPDDRTDEPSGFRTESGSTVMGRLSLVSVAPPSSQRSDASGYVELAGGTLGSALNVLNYLTFEEMKRRSGVVGETGLAPTLTKIKASPGPKIHLAGHSLGARLITAAARVAPAGPPDQIASMTLLQAAFSHYGFSDDWDPAAGVQPGYFRADITGNRFSGPMLITYTANDLLLSIFYAFASGLANDIADLAVGGGPTDRFGAMGRNGALKTPEAVWGNLLAVGGAYNWQAGKPHNLNADAYIANHSDVTGPQVAYATLSAIAST